MASFTWSVAKTMRAGAPLHFFVFDVLILAGRDVMGEPLANATN